MSSSCTTDDNNAICLGTNSEDMAVAINPLAEHGGGQVIVNTGNVLGFLSLPIAGIVFNFNPHDMEKEEILLGISRKLDCDFSDLLFYMCCLQIVAILIMQLQLLALLMFTFKRL